MYYTKNDIEDKKYTVYIDGIRQEQGSVLEVDTNEGWALVIETRYFWIYSTTTKTRKWGRIHMVIEEYEVMKPENKKTQVSSIEPQFDDISDDFHI